MRTIESKYIAPVVLALTTLACSAEGGGVAVKGFSGADSTNTEVKTAQINVETQGQTAFDIAAQGAWVDSSGFTDVDVFDSTGRGVLSFGIRAGLRKEGTPFIDVHLD